MDVHVVRRLLELQNPDNEKGVETKNRKTLKKQMFKALLTETCTMAQQLSEKHGDSKINIPKLFYTYCKESGTSLNRKSMEELQSSMLYAVESMTTKKKHIQDFSLRLLEYAETHFLDGGNTLIGLQPNESFFSQYYGKNSNGVYQIVLSDDRRFTTNREKRGETRSKYIRKKTEKPILFHAGDLAIYFQHGALIPSSAIFVRIVENVQIGQLISRVYHTGLEVVDKGVKTEYLLVIHTNIIQQIQEGPTRELIQDPIEEWQQKISNTITVK